MNQERLLIEMSGESQLELWKETYDIGDSYEINGEIYTSIEELNSLKHSHSSSIDFIVQRKSDGLYFRFNVWSGRKKLAL